MSTKSILIVAIILFVARAAYSLKCFKSDGKEETCPSGTTFCKYVYEEKGEKGSGGCGNPPTGVDVSTSVSLDPKGHTRDVK